SLSHSCSSVYLSNYILLVEGGSAAFVSWFDEWEPRDGDRQALAAQLGEHCCAGHRKRGWQISRCNRGVEARTKATRRHRTCLCACILCREKQYAGAHRRTSLRPQTHAMAGHPLLKLPEYDLSARKPTLACAAASPRLLDCPTQARFDRRQRLVNV